MARTALALLTATLVFAAQAGAHVDAVRAPIYVAIVKGKPVPAQRTIARGASVTWLNGDKGAHRVASDKHAWKTFTLRQAGKHAVKFTRAGRYPYKVDGKAKGVIVVTAGGGGGGGGGSGTTLFHYDVHVTGHARESRTYTGETRPDHNGTETDTIDWDTKFANVTVKKLAAGGTFVILANGGRAQGTTDATFGYTETRGDIYGPCTGTLTFSALATHLLLAGSRASGKLDFTFWSQLELDEGTRMANEIRTQTEAACAPSHGGSAKSIPGWPGDDFVAGGLTFSPFNSLLELHAERKDSSATVWSPLNKLAAASAFTIDSGLVTRAESCGTTCQAQYELRLHADVTRHR